MLGSKSSDSPHFIHLGVRSPYSLSEGAVRLENMIEFCKEHEVGAMGITDTGNLFGALDIALSLSRANIQPIVGMRLPIFCDADKVVHYLSIYPTSERGYRRLLELASKVYISPACEGIPSVSIDELLSGTDDILAHTGTVDGRLYGLINKQRAEKASEWLEILKGAFSDRLYIAISRHDYSMEKRVEPWLLHLSRVHELPLLAIQDGLFYKAEHYKSQLVVYCIAHGGRMDGVSIEDLSDQHYLKSPHRMARLFSDLPEAVENTFYFSKRVSFMPVSHEVVMPRFDDRMTVEEENEYFREKSMRGLEDLRERIMSNNAEVLWQEYEDRLCFEIDVILGMGYAGYFLIVSDFVCWAKSRGIPVGPGRGSGAGSLVAWSLSITEIDPIAWGLLFERFLNPDRVSLPDFDIDICANSREEVLHYVFDKYGHDRVAQIITFGTIRARAAIGDVGRALGKSFGEIEEINKFVSQQDEAGKPVALRDSIFKESVLKGRIRNEPEIKEWIDLALGIEGLYRHASTHAGGIVISERKLMEVIPLYADVKSEHVVTQFDMNMLELSGLVKFDFLGLLTLTIIQHSLDLIKESRGVDLSFEDLDLADKDTFELLSRGDTFGVFQLESTGMVNAMVGLEPTKLEDIVDLVALYRPGPMDNIPLFIERKHGREETVYKFPQLEKILGSTYGIAVYQEQVIQIAIELAGFSVSEADNLRRAMGKKIKGEMERIKHDFVSRTVDHSGVSLISASEMFDEIESFASYGFNKSHAVGYGLLAYQTAYLKSHFTIEFMATCMNVDSTKKERLSKYVRECEYLGIEVLGPDINLSQAMFSIEEVGVNESSIRYGLSHLKGMNDKAVQDIIESRDRGGKDFSSIEDFCSSVSYRRVSKKSLEVLFGSGSFDSLSYNRNTLLISIDKIRRRMEESYERSISGQMSLFGEEVSESYDVLVPRLGTDSNAEVSSYELSVMEKDSFGYYFLSHPLDSFGSFLRLSGFTFYREGYLEEGVGEVKILGQMIRFEKKGRKGEDNYLFYLSDITGFFEVLIYGNVYRDISLYRVGDLLVLRGYFRGSGDGRRLYVRGLEFFGDYLAGDGGDRLELTVGDISYVDRGLLLDRVEEICFVGGGVVDEGGMGIELVVMRGDERLKFDTGRRVKLTVERLRSLCELGSIVSLRLRSLTDLDSIVSLRLH